MEQVDLGGQQPEMLVGKLGLNLAGQITRAMIQHAVGLVVEPIGQMERRKEKRLKGTAQMVGSSNQSQRRGSLSVRELEEHCGWREDEKERERQSGGIQLEKHCGSELARKGKLNVESQTGTEHL